MDADDSFPVLDEVRYLGVRLSQDCQKIINMAKVDVTRYLHAIKGKLRRADLDVKQALMTAFIRSLLIFAATPMLSAKIIRSETIESWERELLRKLHLLPRDLDGRLVANLVRTTEPTQKTVERIAGKINLQL